MNTPLQYRCLQVPELLRLCAEFADKPWLVRGLLTCGFYPPQVQSIGNAIGFCELTADPSGGKTENRYLSPKKAINIFTSYVTEQCKLYTVRYWEMDGKICFTVIHLGRFDRKYSPNLSKLPGIMEDIFQDVKNLLRKEKKEPCSQYNTEVIAYKLAKLLDRRQKGLLSNQRWVLLEMNQKKITIFYWQVHCDIELIISSITELNKELLKKGIRLCANIFRRSIRHAFLTITAFGSDQAQKKITTLISPDTMRSIRQGRVKAQKRSLAILSKYCPQECQLEYHITHCSTLRELDWTLVNKPNFTLPCRQQGDRWSRMRFGLSRAISFFKRNAPQLTTFSSGFIFRQNS